MRRPIARRAVGALLLALVAGSARAEAIQVKIENMTFMPSQVTAHVGDTIEIAKRTGATPAVVRRVVGNLDPQAVADRRRVQEITARRIGAELLPWSEKVKLWTEQTGQSEATFWRVLRRLKSDDGDEGEAG